MYNKLKSFKEGGNDMVDSENPSAQQKAKRVKKAIEASNVHREQKRFHKGIEILREALQYQMEVDQVYYRLGNIYYDAGDLDQAEAAYKRAIEINEEHVSAHHNLSVVYKRKGTLSKFVEMFKKSKRLVIKKPFM